MRLLLQLQELDLRIENCRMRELEIPKQKSKFDVQRQRLAAEVQERDAACKALQVEQRACEGDIEQRQGQIAKYQQQLLAVKKNEEYQALLHEIDSLKKQIAIKEERIIALMIELDDAKAKLVEDKKRIETELKDIDRKCIEIDHELEEAVEIRRNLDREYEPLLERIDSGMLARYKRIRSSRKAGRAVVPINGEICTSCNMALTPQIVNEILGGDKIHTCNHCGSLLYHVSNFEAEVIDAKDSVS